MNSSNADFSLFMGSRLSIARQLLLSLAIFSSGGLPVFDQWIIVVPSALAAMLYVYLVEPRSRICLGPFYFLLAFVAITLLRPGETDYNSLASRLGVLLFAFGMLQIYLALPDGVFARDLRVIIFPIACLGFITFLVAVAFRSAFREVTIGLEVYSHFAYILFFHETAYDSGMFVRPDGIFFEPAVYQIYLNLALILELFIFRNRFRIIFIGCVVLMTQSTAGIMILFATLSVYAAEEFLRTGLRKNVTPILATVLLLAILLPLAQYNIEEKLFGERQGSSIARLYDFLTGINIAIEYPIFGIGFEVERYLRESEMFGYFATQMNWKEIEGRPNSNGIAQIVYALGIPLGLFVIVMILRQRILPKAGVIIIWSIVSLYSQALSFSPFFMLLAFSSLGPRFRAYNP